MNPKMLSIHYTAECDKSCPGCYLSSSKGKKEIEKAEWLELPFVASSMGIEKIAIALNATMVHTEYLFIVDFIYNCRKNGIKVDITTVYESAIYLCAINAKSINGIFKGVDVFSISIDTNKIFSFLQLGDVCNLVNQLKNTGINSINANFLIKKDSKIQDGWFYSLLNSFNTIHIIFEKPFSYTEDEFYNIIEFLDKHDIFNNDRFILDPCVLFKLGLVTHCHSSSYMVDISPDGNVAGCAYSHLNNPIGNINRINELPELLNKTDEIFIKNCSFLKLKDNHENHDKRRSYSHQ